MKTLMQHRGGRAAVVCLAMLVLAAVQAQTMFIASPRPPGRALFLGIPYFIILYNLLWAVFYLFMDRFSLGLLARPKKAAWLLQFPAGIAAAALHISLVYLLLRLFAALGEFLYWPKLIRFRGLFSDFFVYNLMLYALLTVFIYLREFSSQARAKSRKAMELQRQLSEARLLSLKMQLRPHFLFNTLNTLSGYVGEDPAKAEHIIALLGDLLRASLRDRDHAEIPLAEELDFVGTYLEIERYRFPDRLEVRREIDPLALSCPVPPMLLQPVVENAVRHGVAGTVRPGVITIRAEKEGDELRVSVSDNGPGFPAGGEGARGGGIGLRNTRERLEETYGAGGRLRVESAAGEGATVHIRIPCPAGGAAPGTEGK